ncbi:CapA family protein [Actinomyces radicidentis]|uniref:CapA family protein n=2 Tax=Actinomyces radicidentis TaxID=111015 RepID=UPI0028F14498|nr:CapA family protein [Actinomyces radicidentis]
MSAGSPRPPHDPRHRRPDRPTSHRQAASRVELRRRAARRRPTRFIALGAAFVVTVGAGTGVAALMGRDDGVAAAVATGSSAASGAMTEAATATAGPTATPSATDDGTAETSVAPGAPVTLTIGYAGDVLMHDSVYKKTPGGDGDISSMVAAENPWVQGVDLALCGMEVPVSPDGVYSSYPVFGSPAGVVPALKEVGWDGCTTASNHSLDRGMAGLDATLDAFDAAGLGHAGTYRSAQGAEQGYQLYDLERSGRTITVAQIASTYNLNGFTDAQPYTGDNVEINDAERITEQARATRRAGADVVVVQAHLGTEYTDEPTAEQEDFARAIADGGQVDLLLDGHPHVPQTDEHLDGGPNGQGMWVSHCAGNYISAQSESVQGTLSTVGTFVWADVAVDAEGAVSVTGLHWHPFTMDTTAGSIVRDLTALHDGDEPDGLELTEATIERRWDTLMSVMDQSTYDADAPKTTGDAPKVVAYEDPEDAANATASARPEATGTPSATAGATATASATASATAR